MGGVIFYYQHTHRECPATVQIDTPIGQWYALAVGPDACGSLFPRSVQPFCKSSALPKSIVAHFHHFQKGAHMNKVLKIVPEACTGCMRCEMACSYMQTGTYQPSKSVIRVSPFERHTSYSPYTCFQCEEAWCLAACPVEAITISPRRRKGCLGRPVRGVQAVHHRMSLRHHILRRRHQKGVQVQLVRRLASVRGGVPHGSHPVGGGRGAGLAGRLRRDARQRTPCWILRLE